MRYRGSYMENGERIFYTYDIKDGRITNEEIISKQKYEEYDNNNPPK